MAKKKKKPHPAAFPRIGTPAAENFVQSWVRINSFFYWVLHMASSIDHMHQVAAEALRTVNDVDENEENADHKTMIDVLKENRQFFLEVTVVRHIENYLNYLSELLYEIFTGRPETLRSSDKVEISRVLAHASIQDFVRAAAERKVDSLSYSSFSELAEFFQDRFGLTIISSNYESVVVEAIETRNISVHNRCLINDRYCSRTGADSNQIGNRKDIYVGTLDELVPLLFDVVKELDVSARKKLKLKGRRFVIDKPSPWIL